MLLRCYALVDLCLLFLRECVGAYIRRYFFYDHGFDHVFGFWILLVLVEVIPWISWNVSFVFLLCSGWIY